VPAARLLDLAARAGERQERHRQLRVLDRQRERGAELIAIERGMTGSAHPARAALGPVAVDAARRRGQGAGAVAAIAGAARPEIFRPAGAGGAAEAEAVVVERHRLVRVALAGA